MGDWLAVVGTLAGALVAGGISFVLLWSSNKHAQQIVKINLAEERARWAAERQLERIQIFYGSIEKLIASVQQFRIQQAWESSIAESKHEKAPSWVLSYDVAKEGIEDALNFTYSEILLLDEDIQSKYNQAVTHYHRGWHFAKDKQAQVQHIMELEKELIVFKELLAARYRKVFDARRTGSDLVRDGQP